MSRPRRAARRVRLARADLIVSAAYLSLAVLVLSGQWRHTDRGYLIKSGQDQTMWEWFFAVTAHNVAHLENPLGTMLQNYPDGVNMMANTAMFGVGVPLTPVTLLFGPTVTFVLVLTLGLFGTAFAWYWLFSRELVASKFAAAAGGLFCGFAPAMISHANAHPNFVVLALLPLIALQLIRMTRACGARHKRGEAERSLWSALRLPALAPRTLPERSAGQIRHSFTLGLLVALQIALGEEPLLIFALSFGVFALVYYLHTPRAGLRALLAITPTVLLAALITVALTEIPLWWQFFGPQSYRSIDHGPMNNDLEALFQFPSESLGGLVSHGQNVAINATEENSYFGWPLWIVVTVAAVLMWRERAVRAAATVTVAFTVLSLGATLMIGHRNTGIALPWQRLENVPLLNSVLESRFTMAAIPAIALILTLATQRALDYWKVSATDWRPLALFGALAFALLPLTPTILPTVQRAPTPAFFADGTVRRYVSHGSVVVTPPPTPPDARALRWQADSGFEFPLAGGYFVGPTGTSKKGRYGPDDRPTASLLLKAQQSNKIPVVDDAARAQALADLRYWRADVMVLPPTDNSDTLRLTVDQLIGFPATYVDGVWLWDVRDLVGPRDPA
ncbi:glycosyltransferase family protein [Nocardia aurantiaca]|uniref:Glycosyl transferase n=1 Tax=Nocardia aurantiaca TaxID=2675850 RepID=A0A6I3KTA2_9NOCA|nr:glycosyl transferase [Nocardia aurantiaca]MTE12058.1 glycosyl transferase [Nocardia aurantiaca]